MIEQRPGKKQHADPGPGWGVRVIEPGFPSVPGGWWDDFGAIGCCIAAYQPKGAGSLAASYIDLSGNGNNCGPGVAPGWNAANGWMFNGINEYLVTGLIPAWDQSWSALIQFTTVTTVTDYLFGMNSAFNQQFGISPNWGGANCIYSNGASVVRPPVLLAGNLGVAGNQGYRNGAADGGAIGPWAGPALHDIWIGGQNNVGALGFPIAAYVQAMAIYDCVLNAGEVAAVAAWMAAI